MVFCSNCGTKLNDEVSFCSNCGVKVGEGSATGGHPDSISKSLIANANKLAGEEIKVKIKNTGKSIYNKTVIAVVLIMVGCVVAYFAYREYKQYQVKKEAKHVIETLFDLLPTN